MQIIERRGSLGQNYEFFTQFGVEENREKIAQLNAFAAVCERNTQLNKSKVEVPVVDESDTVNGDLPKHAVFATVHQYIETNFDSILDDEALKTDIIEMLDIREYLVMEKQVDLFSLIKIAYNGLGTKSVKAEAAAKRIRELCEEFKFTDVFTNFMRLPNALECVMSYT